MRDPYGNGRQARDQTGRQHYHATMAINRLKHKIIGGKQHGCCEGAGLLGRSAIGRLVMSFPCALTLLELKHGLHFPKGDHEAITEHA